MTGPAIAGGYGHTVAVGADGTLWAWGANDLGQLGVDSTTEQGGTSPRRVGFAADWRAVSAAGNHTIALKTDGTLWGFGVATVKA